MVRCKVIGIIGGVGSGKSLAVDYMKNNYKAYIIKADDVARKLYRKGSNGYKAVTRICGREILDKNCNINRKKLADILYNDESVRVKINNAIHPIVYAKIHELINIYSRKYPLGFIVYEAALLPDDIYSICDEVWYVFANEDVRIERLIKYRHYDRKLCEQIISSQPSSEDYENVCSHIIENNTSPEEMEDRIDEIIKYSQWKQR